jgi:hypothetical protein
MSKTPINSAEAVLAKTLGELEEMLRLYRIAKDIQWERSKRGGERHGGRQVGTHADPTPVIALDPRRQRVRHAVTSTEKATLRLHDEVVTLKGKLGAAIDAWSR